MTAILPHLQRDPEAATRTRRALAAMADILNSLVNSGSIVATGPGTYATVVTNTTANQAAIAAILQSLGGITGKFH
jgi:DNA-binding transcriptional regulator LsrR (DeoR family)